MMERLGCRVDQLAGSLIARLLTFASRRWPPEARENLVREWTAEAYELGHEAGVGAAVRTWRRLRFAASLACVRPQQRRAGRAGRVDAAERVVQHGLALFFAPLAAVGLAFLGTGPLWMYVTAGLASDSVVLTVVYRVAQVAAGVVCGVVLARRLPRARWNEPVSVPSRVAATAVIVAGLVVADAVVRTVARASTDVAPAVVGAVGVGALLLPLTAGVAGLARRSRTWAVVVAAVGAPVVVLSATSLTVWWSDPLPARAAGHPWWWLADAGRLTGPSYLESPIEAVLPLLPGVVLTTVTLALAYTLRLSRPVPLLVRTVARPRSRARSYAPLVAIVAFGLVGCAWGMIPFDAWPALATPVLAGVTVTTLAIALALARRLGATRHRPVAPDPAAIPPANPWWSRIALAGAAYSALAWAVTLTYLTPNIGVQDAWPRVGAPKPGGWPGWSSEEGRVWMQDLQLYAIGCAALCMLLAVAYRGASLLPALGGAVVLLATDLVVVHWHLTEIRLLPWLAAGALLLGLAVWWASIHLGRGQRDAARRQATLVRLTVMAAFLVPGVYFHRYVPGPDLTPSVLLVAVGLPTVLAVLATLGVLATSAPERMGQRPSWRIPEKVGIGAAVIGALSFMDFTRLVTDFLGPLTYLSFMLAPTLAVPAAAVAVAAIRSGRSSIRWGRAQWAGHLALMLPLGWVTAYLTVFAAFIGGRLLPWFEYGMAYDGIPYVAGAFPVALLVAFIAASVVDRPVPAPAPMDHELSISR